MQKKNIVILGSTGSIGTQALEVISAFAEYNVQALAANTSIQLIEQQARKFLPQFVVLNDKECALELEKKLKGTGIEVLAGMSGLNYIAGLKNADIVLNSLVGAVGLQPSITALKAGNDLALANKESMVIGGPLLNKLRKQGNSRILPVDSEHNAIFQLLRGHESTQIKKIILTASGGPFLNLSAAELKKVTVEQALNHPNWEMGAKITIDSATLMNKGLEVIEAHFLFQQPFNKIEVVIHPESVVHSLVEFIDNSIQAEMGAADMKIPLQNVFTYPDQREAVGKELDLTEIGQLNFSTPDFKQLPALEIAYRAGEAGGSLPVVLNAANEIAVGAFLTKKISFCQIYDIIETVILRHNKEKELNLEKILEIDKWARIIAEEVIVNAGNCN